MMWLLHCREVRCDKKTKPGNPGAVTFEEQVAFAYKGNFNSAMKAVTSYSQMCEERDPATEYLFILLTVSQIPDDSDEDMLDSLGVQTLNY